jgi:hypothetical protein
VLAAPDTMKSPMTATYVAAHRRHSALRMKKDAYARYRITARPTVDSTKTYAVTFSRKAGVPYGAAMSKASISANHIAPRIATGTPSRLPYGLKYA